MAKKIAAPRKTAPKTPARKISKAKAVGVPKAYKPKGSPKEKLAYLNKGEMAALVKKKGSPARKGPRGLPSFADDSASSKGVSRGDSSGTKGSGSTKTATGSVSKSSETKSSPSGAGRGQGGQGGYNSGTSGSRYGGASTQKPGMGRNAGRVGPQSPMAGQGTSFATNRAARDDTLRRAYGIEDQRGLQNMPQRPYIDKKYGVTINPNEPKPDREKFFRDRLAARDEEARQLSGFELDKYRNPQEIRANAAKWRDMMDEEDSRIDAAVNGLKRSAPLSQGNFKTNVARAAASSLTPNIKIGRFRNGGAVKSRNTFKKK